MTHPKAWKACNEEHCAKKGKNYKGPNQNKSKAEGGRNQKKKIR